VPEHRQIKAVKKALISSSGGCVYDRDVGCSHPDAISCSGDAADRDPAPHRRRFASRPASSLHIIERAP